MQGDQEPDAAPAHKIAALERLQKSIDLTSPSATKWIGNVRAERRASLARAPVNG